MSKGRPSIILESTFRGAGYGLIALAIILSLTSCAKPDGAKLFDKAGCTTCHKFKGMGIGVIDLSNVSSERDRVWVREQITEPRRHRADTGMPSFAHLKSSEIDALTDFVMQGKK